MTRQALALGGWLTALWAAAGALTARRALAEHTEGVARASHELRGGIGAARLGLALAGREGELGPPRLRAVELELDRAALALQEFDGLPSTWVFGYVDLEGLLTDCVEAVRAAAAVRDVELRLSTAGQGAVVIGDRVRLAQAITNLITNAIEHGGGTVEVRGRPVRDAVIVEVLDDGPGLPKPVPELIRRRRGQGGRGLGLGIAADIVNGHGGRLAAGPSVTGARLTIELPAAQRPQRRLQTG